MRAPSIEIRDLTLGYPGREVMSRVSLTIEGGSLVGLVGPNGAGKSTLLLALGGLLRPIAGTVRIDGREAALLKAGDRARLIALLPQGLPRFIPFTVFETVLMGRYPLRSPHFFYTRGDEDATEALLMATGLTDLAGRRCGELSGGELQRVMLASVLAQETPVLLLDEPTASLDISQQRRFLALVVAAARAGNKTVVLATHDLNSVAAACDFNALIMSPSDVRYGRRQEVLTEENVGALFGQPVSGLEIEGRRFFIPRDEGAR